MTAPRPWWTALALIALGVLTLGQGIATRGLWASHEARAAQNAQSILDDGDWVTPRLFDGQVELQKPAAFYWLVASVGACRGGVDAVAVRLPVLLAAIGSVLAVWWALHRRHRPIGGIAAALILLSSIHFLGTARTGRIDVPLTFAVAITILAGRERRPSLAIIVGASAAMALLLKGPIGLALPGMVLAAWQVVDPRPWRQTIRFVAIAALVAIALGLPWFIVMNQRTDGEFYRVFVLYHHFNRAFGGAEALAAHPWWYYVPRLAIDFLPGTLVVGWALVRRAWRDDVDIKFGMVWLCGMMLLLSLSRFKRADYLLPAYPGAAIIAGCWIERSWQRSSGAARRGLRLGLAGGLMLMPLGVWGFDRLVSDPEQASRDQAEFARVVRELAPRPCPLYLFQVEAHQFTFHAGRPVHTLVEWHDLAAPLEGPGPHLVVTRADLEVDLARRFDGTVIARSVDLLPAGVKPHRPMVLIRVESGPHPWPKPPKD